MNKCFLLVLLILTQQVYAQEMQQLSLAKAYELSQKNYPVVKQKDLIKQTAGIKPESN